MSKKNITDITNAEINTTEWINCIRENVDILDWTEISKMDITKEFIIEFKHKLDFSILKNKQFTKDFELEFLLEMNYNASSTKNDTECVCKQGKWCDLCLGEYEDFL